MIGDDPYDYVVTIIFSRKEKHQSRASSTNPDHCVSPSPDVTSDAVDFLLVHC